MEFESKQCLLSFSNVKSEWYSLNKNLSINASFPDHSSDCNVNLISVYVAMFVNNKRKNRF